MLVSQDRLHNDCLTILQPFVHCCEVPISRRARMAKDKKYLHIHTHHPPRTLAGTVSSGEHHSNYWRATGGDYCDLDIHSLYSSNGAGHSNACWVDVLRALMDWEATDVSGLCCSILGDVLSHTHTHTCPCTQIHTYLYIYIYMHDMGQLDKSLKCYL